MVEPFSLETFQMTLNFLFFFSVMFDENLKKVLQQSQMEIKVRFWDDNDVLVKTRYSLAVLPLEEMHHLSVDGLSVNWKYLNHSLLYAMKKNIEWRWPWSISDSFPILCFIGFK